MSLDALINISRAEEQAKKIKSDAAAEVKRKLKQTEDAGCYAVKAAREKAAYELEVLNQKANEKAAADAAELARSTENKKAAMRARAESRMDGAAALIVERIVNG